jgi:alpha-L-fucosidase
MGGNLLIDIGPKEDGTIPAEQIEILKNLGRWTAINSEAIYGTRRGIPFENYNGKSALSKDGKKLFLYLEEEKAFSKLYSINSTPKKVRIIGDKNAKISFKKDENSNMTIDYQTVNFDKDATVVELEFDESLKLSSDINKTENLNSLLETKNAKLSIYELAYQLSKGNNLLNDKISVDGENMPLKSNQKTNIDVYNWISKHSEAFYETNKGLDFGHYQGMSALSKDRQTLYLFVEGKPTGPIALKGLKNTISRVRIVGEGSIINYHIYNKLYWSKIPGIVYIDVPKERLDKNLTVIAILLDKPLEVYREEVKAIESNL